MNSNIEPIRIDSKDIACDGGGGQLGHPRVFLTINGDQRTTCPYCGQIFVLEPEPKSA